VDCTLCIYCYRRGNLRVSVGRPPNYRHLGSASDEKPDPACIDCKYVVDNRCHAYCVKYSVRVNPWYVCDDWMSRKVSRRVPLGSRASTEAAGHTDDGRR